MNIDQFAGLPPGMAQELQAARRAVGNALANPSSMKQMDAAVERLETLSGKLNPSPGKDAEGTAEDAEDNPPRMNHRDNPYSRISELEKKQREVADSARTQPAQDLKKSQDELSKDLQDMGNMPYFQSSSQYENMMKESMREMSAASARFQSNQGANAQQPAAQAANRLAAAAEKIRQDSERSTAGTVGEISRRLQESYQKLSQGQDQKKALNQLADDVETAAGKELKTGTLQNAEFLAGAAESIRDVVRTDEYGKQELTIRQQAQALADVRRAVTAPRRGHEESALALRREIHDLTAKPLPAAEQTSLLSRTGDVVRQIDTRDHNMRRRIDETARALRTAVAHPDSKEALENA